MGHTREDGGVWVAGTLVTATDIVGQQVVEITILVAMPPEADDADAWAIGEMVEDRALQVPPVNPGIMKPTGRVTYVRLRDLTLADVAKLAPATAPMDEPEA